MTDLRAAFLEGMSRAASTVSLVTTDGPAGRAGVTVSAMSSVSADGDAPSLLVCVHEKSSAAGVISGNMAFCVNVLRDDQAALSDVFSGRTQGKGAEKFQAGSWVKSATGAPVLEDGVVAFDCKVVHQLQWGTHRIFIGKVADIRLNDRRDALVYSNRAYGTTSPLVSTSAQASGSAAHLRVGCFHTFAPYVMPPLLVQYMRACPDATVAMVEGSQSAILKALRDRNVSLAITYDADLPETGFDTDILAIAQAHVLLASGHPLTAKDRISLQDLASEPLVLFDTEAARDRIPAMFRKDGLEPRIGFYAPSFETVRGLVGNGCGYAIVTTGLANSNTFDGKKLVARPLVQAFPERRVVLVRHGKEALTASDEEFRAVCRAYFAMEETKRKDKTCSSDCPQ